MANTQHPNEPQKNAQQSTRTNNNGREIASMPKERRSYLAEQYGYTPEQVDVVRNMIAVGATDSELEFFLATSKRLGLDPFARQVWFVKRPKRVEDDRGEATYVNVGEPQTSIDGYRTVAERSGEYEGQGVMQWCGVDGRWTDVWTKKDPPTAARATIFRRGHREPLVQVALFDEFCPKYRNGKSPAMWLKMPANQLAKCAEAAGLRRAFPRDLSGTSTDVEMEHVYAEASYAAPPLPTAQPKQLDERRTPTITPEEIERQERQREKRKADLADHNTDPPITNDNVVAETLKQVDSADMVSDVDREIARLMEYVEAADHRDALSHPGSAITRAKETLKSNPDDELSKCIIAVIEPALQKKWRELPPAKRSR